MTDKMSPINLKTPLSESDVRSLQVDDNVSITGNIFTGRDRFHHFLFHEKPPKEEIPFTIDGGILYHCGPIIRKKENEYRFISGGPTTSVRLEMYEWLIIKEYGIRAIIGKGGMEGKTLAALKEYGCVYLHTISGAGVYLADRVKKVIDVWKVEEFGEPEAIWLLEVEDFPAIVTMDSHGNSIHERIKEQSTMKAREIFGSPFEVSK